LQLALGGAELLFEEPPHPADTKASTPATPRSAVSLSRTGARLTRARAVAARAVLVKRFRLNVLLKLERTESNKEDK
jgi:hypothetical protein